MFRAASKIGAAMVFLVATMAFDTSAYAAPADDFDTVASGTYGAAERPEPLSNGWYAIKDGITVGTPKDSAAGPKPSAPQSVRLTYFTGSGTPQSPRVAHPGEMIKIVPTKPGQVCDFTVLLGQGGVSDSMAGTYYARLRVDAFAQVSAGIETYSATNPKILSVDYSAAGKFQNPYDVFWERMRFVNIKPTTSVTALRISSSTNTWVDDIGFNCR